jgi:hypothetical protein
MSNQYFRINCLVCGKPMTTSVEQDICRACCETSAVTDYIVKLKAFIKRHAKELTFGGEPTTALGRAARKFALDAAELLKEMETTK